MKFSIQEVCDGAPEWLRKRGGTAGLQVYEVSLDLDHVTNWGLIEDFSFKGELYYGVVKPQKDGLITKTSLYPTDIAVCRSLAECDNELACLQLRDNEGNSCMARLALLIDRPIKGLLPNDIIECEHVRYKLYRALQKDRGEEPIWILVDTSGKVVRHVCAGTMARDALDWHTFKQILLPGTDRRTLFVENNPPSISVEDYFVVI